MIDLRTNIAGNAGRPLDRREAIKIGASVIAAGLGAGALVGCQSTPQAVKSETPVKISLAQWSLHRALQAGQLDHLDFPRTATREYGIDAVEYVSTFFKEKGKASYIAELKKRCGDEGVASKLIMCDGEGSLGDPDGARRTQAVENHHKWVDAAKELGCHSIRVNAYSAGAPDEQRRLVADGLRRLTEYGAKADLNVIVENHGGLSSNGGWLADVMRTVSHPRCGTLPDFGNFNLGNGQAYDRYRGVAEMMPFARACSDKSYDFDKDGNETTIDYRRMMRIVYGAGYAGWLGVEYEGERMSEPDGIRATKRLIERVWAEMHRA